MEADARRLRLIALLLMLASAGLVGLALLLGAGGLDLELIAVLRAPRVAAAAGVGALLALAGLAMQVLLRNPLADPYVLGTSGGAAMGALLALSLGLGLALGAAFGALLAAAALLLIARRALAAGDEASARLILSGAMLAALFGAAVSLLLTLTPDQRLRGAIFWLIGDLSGANGGIGCLLGAGLLVLVLLVHQRSIDRLLLGSEAALLLGEPVRRLRLALLVAAALATALAVATAGAIGFVGLVVPKTLRLLGVQRTRWLAPLAALGGAALLVGADLLARLLAAPMELPVGALMALIGAPVFIALLARSRA